MSETLTEGELSQFIGTEHYYRHGLNRKVCFTDGVKYMADKAGAYWLVDEIALTQIEPKVAREPFQVWTLRRHEGKSSATLTCDNGNRKVVYSKEIDFTNFPLDEVKLYFVDNIILLTSEY